VIRSVTELCGCAHCSLTQAKAARNQDVKPKATTKVGQPPQTTRFHPDHGVRGRGVWPQVWPQKQALRNRAAPSALQKVATKHLQSPYAPHHTLMTVSNHRTIGQPRALTHRPRCIISDPSHLSAASLIPETGYLRTEIKPKGRLKADNSMNT